VRRSHRFFAEAGVEVINVTWRAIEEIAREIRRKLGVGTAFEPSNFHGA